MDSLLQRLDGLSGNVLANARGFHSHLPYLRQLADRSEVRLRSVSRPELSNAICCPAAFGVVTLGVASRTSRKDGRFTSRQMRFGYVEDQPKYGGGSSCGRHDQLKLYNALDKHWRVELQRSVPGCLHGKEVGSLPTWNTSIAGGWQRD